MNHASPVTVKVRAVLGVALNMLIFRYWTLPSSQMGCRLGLIVFGTMLAGLFGPTAAAMAQSSVSSADSANAARYLIQGTTEAQLGDYEEAISYLEAALERLPGDPTLLLALADAYKETGDLATALFYARQAQHHGSSRPNYTRRLAELQRAAHEPRAALRTYSQLLDQFPQQHAAHRDRAQLLTTLGRPDAALNAYETYLHHTLQPAVSVYRQMLSLYDETGDRAGQKAILQMLVERRPNASTYRRQLGDLYADEGRPEAALELLRPLARQRPDDVQLQRQVRRLARQADPQSSGSTEDAHLNTLREKSTSVEALVRRAQSIYQAEHASSPASSRLRTADDFLQRTLFPAPLHSALDA